MSCRYIGRRGREPCGLALGAGDSATPAGEGCSAGLFASRSATWLALLVRLLRSVGSALLCWLPLEGSWLLVSRGYLEAASLLV